MEACSRSRTECVKYLLEHGADIKLVLRPLNGNTAFEMACKADAVECARLLLQHGADVNSASTVKNGIGCPAFVSLAKTPLLKINIE
jgi:ankyrin repeat protein